MQDRRYRPGDVLDDYCPRERRITDHAIVAMIDDEIRRTRCGSCDAEHEYKEAKVPSPRRKTQPPALFNQVLENAIGPTAPHHAAPDMPDTVGVTAAAHNEDEPMVPVPPEAPLAAEPVEPVVPVEPVDAGDEDGEREGGFRRSLIRAT